MKEKQSDSEIQVTPQNKLPYSAPELTVYNQAAITLGGTKVRAGFDSIGGGTTTYRSS